MPPSLHRALLTVAALVTAASVLPAGVILRYNAITPVTLDSHITASPFGGPCFEPIGCTAVPVFSLTSSGFGFNNTPTSLASAQADNAFFEFTVTPLSGYQLNLTALSFELGAAGSSGDVSGVFVYLLLNGALPSPGNLVLAASRSSASDANWQVVTAPLTAPAYQSLTTPANFRFYPVRGASSAPVFAGFQLSGETVLTEAPAPEPASLLLAFAGCALAVARYLQQRPR